MYLKITKKKKIIINLTDQSNISEGNHSIDNQFSNKFVKGSEVKYATMITKAINMTPTIPEKIKYLTNPYLSAKDMALK